MRYLALLLLAFASQIATAETVQVKYLGPVPLDSFACTEVSESSDVSRICYDVAERYMIIRLKTTYYHYCEIDTATVQALQAAKSRRQYFEARIRGSGQDGPFDCRTHRVSRRSDAICHPETDTLRFAKRGADGNHSSTKSLDNDGL